MKGRERYGYGYSVYLDATGNTSESIIMGRKRETKLLVVWYSTFRFESWTYKQGFK
jgi:hypothetical protein